MGNRSNLLGDSSQSFVQKQIKTRQENLSVDPINGKTTEQIVWQNAKTSYIALASSVDIKNTPSISFTPTPPVQKSYSGDYLSPEQQKIAREIEEEAFSSERTQDGTNLNLSFTDDAAILAEIARNSDAGRTENMQSQQPPLEATTPP